MIGRDHEACLTCTTRGRVVDSRNDHRGCRWRRHACPTCGRRWTTWQSLVKPTAYELEKTWEKSARPQ